MHRNSGMFYQYTMMMFQCSNYYYTPGWPMVVCFDQHAEQDQHSSISLWQQKLILFILLFTAAAAEEEEEELNEINPPI